MVKARKREHLCRKRVRAATKPVQRRVTPKEATPFRATAVASVGRWRPASPETHCSAEIQHAAAVERSLHQEVAATTSASRRTPKRPVQQRVTIEGANPNRAAAVIAVGGRRPSLRKPGRHFKVKHAAEVGRGLNQEAAATTPERWRTLKKLVQRRVATEESNPFRAEEGAPVRRWRPALGKPNCPAENQARRAG